MSLSNQEMSPVALISALKESPVLPSPPLLSSLRLSHFPHRPLNCSPQVISILTFQQSSSATPFTLHRTRLRTIAGTAPHSGRPIGEQRKPHISSPLKYLHTHTHTQPREPNTHQGRRATWLPEERLVPLFHDTNIQVIRITVAFRISRRKQ